MKLHLEFVWNDETGETEISSSSAESIQEHFAEDIPIHVLDFLQDAVGMAIEEYNNALNAYNERLIQRLKT